MITALFRPLVFAALLALPATFASAGPLAAPSSEPILAVSGSITNTNDGEVARLDREMLEAIGTVKISTMTPWYDHVVEFEGVSMKALMDYVGAQGSEVTAIALNDYRSVIPMSDFETYDVILAMKRDGEIMPIRDKGPLFVVYPYDSDPDLKSERYYSRSVWQVKELEVR
jgi:hypothetical protein